MKKEMTLGNFLGIAVPIFVLLFGWGISISIRLNESLVDIKHNEDDIRQQDKETKNNTRNINSNFKTVINKIDEEASTTHDKLDRILYHEMGSNK